MQGVAIFFAVLSAVILYLNYGPSPKTKINKSWYEAIDEKKYILLSWGKDFCSNGVPPIVGWRKLL